MTHEPECPAGPDDNGWQPPCDGNDCSYCWDVEDNCKCRCEWIRVGLKRGYTAGYNAHAAAAQHWQDTHGAYTQHGEGENP